MSAGFRVGVQAGDGIVARLGTAVIVADAHSGVESFTNVVLAELDGGQISGADAAWRIAELLVQNRQSAPSFGVVVAVDSGYQLLLRGNVRAVIDGNTTLAGTAALTWLDYPVPAPVAQIALSLAPDGSIQADPRTDLRGGSVPGNGFVLSTFDAATAAEAMPEPAVAASPEPAVAQPAEPTPAAPAAPAAPVWTPPPLPEPDDHMPTSVIEPITAEPALAAAPEPVAFAPSEPAHIPFTPQAAAPVPDQTSVVPVAESFRPQAAATPAFASPVTTLVGEDGTRTPLDRSYVFGREPQQDPLVAQGDAVPIRLEDPEQLISRVQAYLHVDQHGVSIRDARSANGTFIAAPGAPDWSKLGDGAVLFPVGYSIRMGRRVFTHVGAGQ